MLEIINSRGVTLQPDADTVIPVEVYNPLFLQGTEVFQELIYSANAGLTENNKRFIQGGHLVEAKNEVYEQPVQVLYRGSVFFVGTFRYKISKDQINFELKVNFGTVAAKLKATTLREILTQDVKVMASTELATHMKDTCLKPSDYPYAFFPVKNEQWKDTTAEIKYPWMNYWDHETQKFVVTTSRYEASSTLQVPFYRLSYILKLVFEYLNFSLEGELLSDPEFNALYIYTRRMLSGSIIYPAMNYMPAELTLSEFLKGISERLKVNFTYSLLTGKVTMESPLTALQSTKVEDITNYVETIEEISTSTRKGYKVALSSDTTDSALDLQTDNDGDSIYKPLYTLIVGSGETEVNLEVSTLNSYQDKDYSYPVAKQPTDLDYQYANIKWPIRLLKYTGMKTLTSAKVFPQAEPYNLTENDALFYRFIDESKKVILNANLPARILARLRPVSKFAFKSAQGTPQIGINAKFSYNLTAQNSDLVAVKIECQKLVDDYNTAYSIQKYVAEAETASLLVFLRYKFAYEGGSQPPGSFELVPTPKKDSAAIFGNIPAAAPADLGGAGGQTGIIYGISGSRSDYSGYTLRIYGKVPLYAICFGTKYYFKKEADYYTLDSLVSHDQRPVLIVLQP